MKRRTLRLSVGFALASFLSAPLAPAQQPPTDEVKKDIRALKEDQKAILKDLREIKALLQKEQAVPTPAPTRAPTPAPPVVYTLDAPRREALIKNLRAAPPGSPAWIVATTADPKAIALSEELAAAFAKAGWRVVIRGRTQIPVKAGLFLFAGQDVPPDYVGTAQQALEAAGLSPTYSTGYREYYEEMVRTRPGFRGFPLAADQTFVLVIGRAP